MARTMGSRAMRRALLAQADALAAVMGAAHGRSAMVRVFLDDQGRVVAACNVYGRKGGGMGASTPIMEFREVVE